MVNIYYTFGVKEREREKKKFFRQIYDITAEQTIEQQGGENHLSSAGRVQSRRKLFRYRIGENLRNCHGTNPAGSLCEQGTPACCKLPARYQQNNGGEVPEGEFCKLGKPVYNGVDFFHYATWRGQPRSPLPPPEGPARGGGPLSPHSISAGRVDHFAGVAECFCLNHEKSSRRFLCGFPERLHELYPGRF